jgi:hypothetical protein
MYSAHYFAFKSYASKLFSPDVGSLSLVFDHSVRLTLRRVVESTSAKICQDLQELCIREIAVCTRTCTHPLRAHLKEFSTPNFIS